jgi:hypothetical protein
MEDLREVHGLKLDGPTYRDITRLSENSGRGINGEIAVACQKWVKDKFATLERIAKDALRDELNAIKEAERKADESIVVGASHETDIVRAARERLSNG